MPGGVTTTSNPSNLIVPGAYVYDAPPQQSSNVSVDTALSGRVGVANWGRINSPQPSSVEDSIKATWGDLTVDAHSLVEDLMTGMPEGPQQIGVRVTDGTDTAATLNIMDGAGTPAVVLALTAAFTGTLPSAPQSAAVKPAQARVDLASGALNASPVLRVTLFFPYQPPEVFNTIIAYATPGGGYDATAFQANALAAINGTAPGSVKSRNWTVAAGASTVAPVTATLFTATGGGNGATGVVAATLIGTNGVSSRTGMYALAGTGVFQFTLAGLTDFSQAQTIAAFAQSQSATTFLGVATGTSTDAVIDAQLANNAQSDFLAIVKDYLNVQDTIAQKQRLVSPLGKAAGIFASLDPEQSPLNKPATGVVGIISTERCPNYPYSDDEMAQLVSHGILTICNQMPREGGLYGFPHGFMSSGTPANVVRMRNYLNRAFGAVGGPLVGELQSSQPDDDFRKKTRGAFKSFLQGLVRPKRRIDFSDVICDLSNNTLADIGNGICQVKITVGFLSEVRIFFVTLQSGTAVQVLQQAA